MTGLGPFPVRQIVRREECQQMYDFPKPGPEHKQLEQLTGTWDSAVKVYFQPDAPPYESSGECVTKLDLGGYFLIRDFSYGGEGFRGRGLTGYDPFQKKYLGVWVDSDSPGVYRTEGSFDASGKIFTETSDGPDPQGKPLRMRMTTEIKDENHLLFKIYRRGEDGGESLLTEITHTRRK
jgi:hypothetical protein